MKTLIIILGLAFGVSLTGNVAAMSRPTQSETTMTGHSTNTMVSKSGKAKKAHAARAHHPTKKIKKH